MPLPPPPPHILDLLRQAAVLYQQNNWDAAETLYRRILAEQPGEFLANHMMGVLALSRGRHGDALPWIEAALKTFPQSADALANLGYCLRLAGRLPEALAATDKALAFAPNGIQALFNRAAILDALHRPEEALAAYDRVLAVNPELNDAIANRAILLRGLGRLDEALAAHDRLLARNPRDADTLYNRGVTLRDMHRLDDALAGFDASLALRPDAPHALHARANTLWDLNRFEEALASCDRALALAPDFADALTLRGTILWDMKRGEEALGAYDRALAVAPDHPYARGDRANVVLHLCDWPRVADVAASAPADIRNGRALISPFTLLGYDSDPALQRDCARALLAHQLPVRPTPLAAAKPYHHGRIRLAYLSHDFCEHPVAIQIAELIERHDRAAFEVIGVSTGPDDGGPMRQRLAHGFDQFLDMTALSNLDAARRLREMEVDILVDLGGHTHGARLEIFSHRPAPVQVSYLGYPGTTGADFMDYVLGDRIATPFDQQAFYSEKIVQLPGSYMVNDAARAVGPAPGRAELGLPEQGCVFCSFNKFYKIGGPVFAVWMRLLHQVPGSVLWLKDDGAPAAKARLLAAAQDAGIDPARIIFAGRAPGDMHLARHRAADMFLDTLPYNAHATACDALFAGLPVITVLGNCFAGRVAASLLHAVDMPELVTADLAAYEALALKLARDPAALAAMRDKLARNLVTAPLFDTPRFARNLETAYRMMMDRLARGQAPDGFAVEE